MAPGAPAWAGPNADARILVHLLAPTRKNACTRPEATPECAGIVTKGALAPEMYYAYLLVVGGDAKAGVAGVQASLRMLWPAVQVPVPLRTRALLASRSSQL